MRNEYQEGVTRDWAASSYYSDFDNDGGMHLFWVAGGVFRRMFDQLDTAVTLDLACGHGRHTNYVVKNLNCDRIYAIDVNQTNIDHCENRFAGEGRVVCVKTDGSTLPTIEDGELTSLFCYDAMVHFEVDDVFAYLREFARVLKPGGRALIHHSNNDRYPGNRYNDNPHWRNYMSAGLFKHMAMRSGLVVLDQQILDWSGQPMLDCLTLLERPR